MAITEVGTSGEVGYAKSGTSYKLKAPAGVKAGDILVVCAGVQAASETWTAPSGWASIAQTELSGELAVSLWWIRYETGSEWTFSWSASGLYAVWCTAYRGCVATGSPIDPATGGERKKFSEESPSLAISLADPGEMVVMFATLPEGRTWTAPSGWSVRANSEGFLFADKSFTAAGSTGLIEPTAPAHIGGDEWVLELVGLLPAATTGKLEGTITASTSFSGKAQAKGDAKGTITASAALAGKAQAKGSPHGTLTATTTLSGRAQAKGDPAGTIAATTALDGDLQGAKGTLHGTLASGSNLTGGLQAPGRLEGDLPVLSSLSGRLAGFGHLAGELVAQSAWSGMAQARGVLRGVLDVVVELTGRLAHPEHFSPGKATITVNRVNNATVAVAQVDRATVGARVINHAEVGVVLL